MPGFVKIKQIDKFVAAGNAIAFAGSGSYTMVGTAATITDAYVPSGTRTFHVSDASGLAVGKTVLVGRPVTQAWVDFMGMNTLVRDGMAQTWIAVGTTISTVGCEIYNSSASNKVVYVGSFGGTQSVTAGTLTLVQPTNGVGTSLLQLN